MSICILGRKTKIFFHASYVLFAGIVTVHLFSQPVNSIPSAPKIHIRRSDSFHRERSLPEFSALFDNRNEEKRHAFFTATPGFSRSFRSHKLAEDLLGDDVMRCSDESFTILVQGSAVENRNQHAWLADYFYLPRNYDGAFTIHPHISTLYLDLGLNIDLDCFLKGFYLRAQGSLAHTKWNLDFCDSPGFSNNREPRDHDVGYFSPRSYSGRNLVQSFGQFVNQCAIPQPEEGANPVLLTASPIIGPGPLSSTSSIIEDNTIIAFHPLEYAKMSDKGISRTGFAGIYIETGWDFYRDNVDRAGISVIIGIPTSKANDPHFLFSPVIGNGKHWELGIGFHGNCLLWKHDERYLALSIDVCATHFFKNTQTRTFDLKDRPNSAYSLASKFGPNGGTVTISIPLGHGDEETAGAMVAYSSLNNFAGVPFDPNALQAIGTPTSSQFALEYAPVANITTIPVSISATLQTQATILLSYHCSAWSFDMGYNFWGRSQEKIRCIPCDLLHGEQWALKGDARMFGYIGVNTPPTPFNVHYDLTAVPLSATESLADIHEGTNRVAPDAIAPSITAPGHDINLRVDSSQFAYIVSPRDINGFAGSLSYRSAQADPFANTFLPSSPGSYTIPFDPAAQIKTSSNPQFLKYRDLDYASIRLLSHTIFCQISHQCTFKELGNRRHRWHVQPFFGLGFSAELGMNSDKHACRIALANISCKKITHDGAGSEWSLWLKSGIVF